jgi:hypothetical protein
MFKVGKTETMILEPLSKYFLGAPDYFGYSPNSFCASRSGPASATSLEAIFTPFFLYRIEVLFGNPRRRWIGVLARRIDQHLAPGSPARIVLRYVRRRR